MKKFLKTFGILATIYFVLILVVAPIAVIANEVDKAYGTVAGVATCVVLMSLVLAIVITKWEDQ